MKIDIHEDPKKYACRQIMTIVWDDGSFEQHCDGGEPEDNMFYRDWSWVSTAIERAYDDGRRRGVEDGV